MTELLNNNHADIPVLEEIERQIAGTMCVHRHKLMRECQRLKRAKQPSAAIERLRQKISQSLDEVEKRAATVPPIDYPENLPVAQNKQAIADCISTHQVVLIAGETGSGKTTQLPKICLEIGLGRRGKIGHTQPRRLAARTVAARIAEELKVSLGEQVGYQVRFSDQSGDHSLVKLMTDGILLAEIQSDPYLNQYDTLIIDEAHERSLNIDFLLGYLKRILPQRPDLKLIITSATIDLDRIAAHFDNAPIIQVSGRTYPVEVLYQPPVEDAEARGEGIGAAVRSAVAYIQQLPRQQGAKDILVFLSGEREIRELAKELKHAQFKHTEILPLYARLSNKEQAKVFQPHRGQRIVLATNVAETSLTVPGIRYVIDTGLARISRYSLRSKVQRLPIEAISQASAEQRKGRCGRIAEGLCIRLYEEQDYLSRPKFTEPEIQRTNLAAVILQMLSLRIGDVYSFPFLDKPEHRAIRDGFTTLVELGAVDANGRLTKLGRQLNRFPVDPRVGRMLVAAADEGSLTEVLIIAAALTLQDPRERPVEKQQAADQKHSVYLDPDSDFLSLLNLWAAVEAQRQELSQSQFSKWCKSNFLSYLRIREWRDLHRQLLLAVREAGFKLNNEAADYAAVHRALLSGLLINIGQLDEERNYLGVRNKTFHIFPGSGLFKKPPKWVMAAELVETSRLYARTVAKIEAGWVEDLARHLVKRDYAEPRWSKRRGQVEAIERTSFYGLQVGRRQTDFGRIDPSQAREIFIREALVEAGLETKLKFYQHNLELIGEIEGLEHKTRRRDILVEDEVIFEYYDKVIPDAVYSRALLESWHKQAPANARDALYLPRDYLIKAGQGFSEAQFPNSLTVNGVELALHYHFEPGSEEDGISLDLPLALLNQVPSEQLQWLVPGMLEDKCIAMVKLLPKPLRKQLVPVPATMARVMPELKRQGDLAQALALAINRVSGVKPDAGDFDLSRLDAYYSMHIRVLDESGRCVGKGRDINALRSKLKGEVRQSLQQVSDSSLQAAEVAGTDFGVLFEPVEVEQAGMRLTAYPTLVDRGDRVKRELVDNIERAKSLAVAGLTRLYQSACSQQEKYLRKNLPKLHASALLYTGLGPRQALVEGLLALIFRRVFLGQDNLPADETSFNKNLDANKARLIEVGNETAVLVHEILQHRHEIAKDIETNEPPAWRFIYSDIAAQLGELFRGDFLRRTDWQKLQHYPRYLKAVRMRMDKIQNQLARETQWCGAFLKFRHLVAELEQELKDKGLDNTELEEFRWMLEEYRVSLYAQTLGTAMPVSEKRLQRQLAKIRT